MLRGHLAATALRSLALLAVLSIAGVLLLACGESEDIGNGGGAQPTATPTSEPGTATPTTQPPAPPSPTTTPDRIDHPIGKDATIVRVMSEGGFAPPNEALFRVPLFMLDGRGCVITQGPMIEIYPQPALPNLLETCLQEEGTQYILAAAKDAGLLDGDAHYPMDMIADATTIVFEVNAGGKTVRVSAYALLEGDDEYITGPDAEQQIAARKKLVEFLNQVGGLQSWIPPNNFMSVEEPYEIERMQVAVLASDSPYAPYVQDELQQQELEWPLAGSLAGFGEPFFLGYRCALVEGEDLETLTASLREANRLTLWISGSGGESYYLFPRPLLGGEEGCAA
jgi:hypothetical protein